MVTLRKLGVFLGGAVLALVISGVGDAPAAGKDDSLVLVYEGNRLSVKQSASVPYSDLQSMLQAVRRSPLIDQYGILLFRNFPRSIAGYVFAVEREGTLSLGSQLHEWDAADYRYRFSRSELFRSYQPLEGELPWTWLVEIPVSRTVGVSLVIRAVEERWPVKSVSISVRTQPPS